ncbi:iron-containing alcohol dehydrogenase [Acetobacter sp.]|jgi:alcohol dehydrogenase class IV|uniref:iron-containing alcohol dehydrogenase n=1 Tax=Acetobacter sp. TaxID=440 RepID=UPI0025C4B4D8|nr:iron-containing alcohol dehydrogenase [Acetobacter sp.]MCH4091564.1 iron-containing alcohol dehydrogenase [Acetobacter sp.]
MSEQTAYWGYPTNILLASGCSAEAVTWCGKAGRKRPLIVTDPGVRALPWFEKLTATLRASCPDLVIFSEIHANPTLDEAKAGAKFFRDGRQDSIIAIGGGSAIDAAKGIALASRNPDYLEQFEWSQAMTQYPTLADYPKSELPPMIVIPTTAGTGSELSREAVLVDSDLHIKKVITHAELLAFCVLLDPELTVGLPPGLTAMTGMDALVHHIEALCSPLFHPMSEGIALEGIRLVAQHLPKAFTDGSDLTARAGMLIASAMAAVAFQKGLGGVHALAHPIGARFGMHHGLLNAILLPYVLRANRNAIEPQMNRLARILDLEGTGFDAVESWILSLRKNLNVPHDLHAASLTEDDAEWVGQQAVADISSSETNALLLNAEQYATIYRAAVRGRLEDVSSF